MSPRLFAEVRALIGHAGAAYAGSPAEPLLRQIAARLDAPLRVAIAGRVKAGKSTLLNALVGQELAATDASECTRVVTWYQDGPTYRAMLYPTGGPPRQLPFGRPELGDLPPEAVDRIVVDWPSAWLRAMTLIDTPGLGSANEAVSARTEVALLPEGGMGSADAVVYLMRHVHGDDVRFMEAFHDEPAERQAVNTIGVLSRADEVGHGRMDALTSAARIADRYARDSRIRALCQTVVPVAGLLASSAASLRESEYRGVRLLAAASDDDLRRLLLSADHFVDAAAPVEISAEERATLMDRLGMFGVRLAIRLTREGTTPAAAALSRELLAHSGLHQLRTLLATRFAERAGLLKARSALKAVEPVLRTHGRLLPEWERVVSGAHEFAELQLIDQIRLGIVLFTSDEGHDAERLLGGAGADIPSRLGLPRDAAEAHVRRAGEDQLRRWQRRAEHPASPREVRDAARVLVRTCEGILLARVRSGVRS